MDPILNYVISSGAIGALIGYLLKEFIDFFKRKEERRWIKERELFFKIQEKAEMLFLGLYDMERVVQRMEKELRSSNMSPLAFQNSLTREYEKMAPILHVYFFSEELTISFNALSKSFSCVKSIYFGIAEKANDPMAPGGYRLTSEDITNINDAFGAYYKNLSEVNALIRELLEEQEKKAAN